ncbi:hypothetical protein ES703_75028 [subsurface metagenome]
MRTHSFAGTSLNFRSVMIAIVPKLPCSISNISWLSLFVHNIMSPVPVTISISSQESKNPPYLKDMDSTEHPATAPPIVIPLSSETHCGTSPYFKVSLASLTKVTPASAIHVLVSVFISIMSVSDLTSIGLSL